VPLLAYAALNLSPATHEIPSLIIIVRIGIGIGILGENVAAAINISFQRRSIKSLGEVETISMILWLSDWCSETSGDERRSWSPMQE
jgi:hypothetical protein